MKYLIFSDLHAHNYKAFSKINENGINTRLLSIIDNIKEIQCIGKQENVDKYIFCGDLFHTQGFVEVVVYNLIFDVFSEFKRPVICIPGNHDNYGSEKICDNAYQKFSSLKNIHILDYNIYDNIVGVGYHKTYNLDFLKSQKKESILLLHDVPMGYKLANYTFEQGINWLELEQYYDFIMIGHIHFPKQLSKKTIVVGSSLEHSFSDYSTENRGVWILDKNEYTYIPIKAPKFIKTNKLTDAIKQDNYNYYMVVSNDINDMSKDNVIVSKQEDKVEKRFGNINLVNNVIINSYVDIIKGKIFERGEEYKKYGLFIVDKAELNTNNITPSMYRLQKVTLEGFLSFRDKIEFEIKKGVWLVVGCSDTFSSNGSGKTSFFESIFWGIFGKTTKGIVADDVINDLLEKNCRVILELTDILGNTVKIDRFRKYDELGTGLYLYVNEERIAGTSTMVEKKIRQLLGYDEYFFLNTIYYSQESSEFFADTTDAKKKEFLEVILQLNKYSIAQDFVKEDMVQTEKEILRIVTQKEYISNEINTIQCAIKEYEDKMFIFESERNVLLQDLNKKVCMAEALLMDINKVVDMAKENKKVCDDNYNNVMFAIEKLKDKKKDSLDISNKKLYEIETQMYMLKKAANEILKCIHNVKGLQEGILCESCGGIITQDNKIKFIEKKELDQDKIIKEINQHDTLKQEIVFDNMALEKKFTNDMNVQKAREVLLKGQLVELQTTIEAQQHKKIALEYEIKSLNCQIKDREDTQNIYKGTIKEFETLHKNKIAEIKQLDTDLQNCFYKKDMLLFWEAGFSNKGIKSYLLDDFCMLFNEKVSNVIAEISEGKISVLLKNQTKLKSGEISEKLSLITNINNITRNYNQLSGGEKRRVDIAVIITLNKIIREMYKIPESLLGMLIFDEIFSFIDDAGEESIYNMLQELNKDIPTIYVITHSDELKSYFTDSITIEKCGHVSSVL